MLESASTPNEFVEQSEGAPLRRSDNPYVGPRSIGEGEKIYGREREALEWAEATIGDVADATR